MEKQIEKYVFHFCAYTLIISSLFYAFAALSGMQSISMSVGRYFVIVGFSALITIAELIFKIKSLSRILCYIIHFATLFTAFLVVFILINEQTFKASFILSSLIIFALCYFVILGIIQAYKNFKKDAAKKLNNKKSNEKKESTYTSKFSWCIFCLAFC